MVPLPKDREAERVVLSRLILTPEVFDEVSDVIRAEHFAFAEHQKVFIAIRDLLTANKPVDLVSIQTQLKDNNQLEHVGGTPFLVELSNAVPALSNYLEHAATVQRYATARSFIELADRAALDARLQPGLIDGIIEQVTSDSSNLALRKAADPVELLGSILARELPKLDKDVDDADSGHCIPTGYPNLDAQLGGGAHAGDLIIIAGRPGMGKSAFMLNLAANSARPISYVDDQITSPGFGTCIFSLEMPRHQLALRLLSSESRVPFERIRTRNLNRSDWDKITETAGRIARWPLWIDDTPQISITDIRQRVRWLKHQIELGKFSSVAPCKRLGSIYIDYLQLVKGDKSYPVREQEISAISQFFKALAKETDASVGALSQLNRSVEKTSKKRPVASDLRESGAIEQDADVILFVFRDGFYDSEPDPNNTAGDITIAKQRNGPQGRIPMIWRGDIMRFFPESSIDGIPGATLEDGELMDFGDDGFDGFDENP